MVHSVQLPLQTEADGFVHGRMDDQGLSLLAQTMEHQVRPATCQPRLEVVVVVAVAVAVAVVVVVGVVLVLVLLLLFSETSTCTTESQLRRQKYAS